MFKKEKELTMKNNHILVTALLIHAAKMDENYTEKEKIIIKKAISSFANISEKEIDETLKIAEQKEQVSNHLIEFTREIKKNDMSYRLKIIEILWKIIYSDGTVDMYESNLMRRICGLLYVSDKQSGELKEKISKDFIN